jgi:hypothetical protein
MYYTYISYNSADPIRKYIGYHEEEKGTDPRHDNYFGKFNDSTFSPDSKIVLGRYSTAADAKLAEYQLQKLFDVECDLDFVNRKIHSPAFIKNSNGAYSRKMNLVNTRTGETALNVTAYDFLKIRPHLSRSAIHKVYKGIRISHAGWELEF